MSAMANLTGLFYEKYADKVETLYQTVSILKNDIAFVSGKNAPGANFNQPVIMSPEQGFTYAAPSATPAPVSMNGAISMQMVNAQVAPYQMMARCVLDYETANRSIAGRAFEPAAVMQMANVLEQANTRLELSLLYGQEGLGVSSGSVNVSATSTDITFTLATWSDAAWGSTLNASVQFWTAGGVLISSGADSVFTVTRATTGTRVVRVTGTATGITALDAATAAGASAFFFGTRTGAAAFNEMPGLSKIATNSGTLFGIDAAQYDLWKGNSYSVGGALTLAKLQAAIAVAAGRGLKQDVKVYVPVSAWANLLTEQTALRRYDGGSMGSTVKTGAENIEFFSQNGKMSIIPHPFVKNGDAFIAAPSKLRRIGSTDISFTVPGPEGKNKDMFQDLVDSAGYQYKLYTGQTLFCSAPATLIKLTGIVST